MLIKSPVYLPQQIIRCRNTQQPAAYMIYGDPDERKCPRISNHSSHGGCNNVPANDPGQQSGKKKMKAEKGCKGNSRPTGKSRSNGIGGSRYSGHTMPQITKRPPPSRRRPDKFPTNGQDMFLFASLKQYLILKPRPHKRRLYFSPLLPGFTAGIAANAAGNSSAL